jgi:hypothetical protein
MWNAILIFLSLVRFPISKLEILEPLAEERADGLKNDELDNIN